MRTTFLLAIVAALLVAGCTGGEESEGGPTTTPPVDTTTPPTTTTPEPEENETSEPAPLPPVNLCGPTRSFAQAPSDPSNPNAAETAACGDLPEGYDSLTLNVTWSLDAPAFLGTTPKVTLVDPAGTAAGSCDGPAAGAQAPPDPCTVVIAAPAAGAWTLAFEGHGPATATISVAAP